MTKAKARPTRRAAVKPKQPNPEVAGPAPAAEPARGQVRYRVSVACTDFTGRYREPGEIVEVPVGVKVPKWFQPLGEDEPREGSPQGSDEPQTLSEVTARLARELAIPGAN